jgi:hypothetical protein
MYKRRHDFNRPALSGMTQRQRQGIFWGILILQAGGTVRDRKLLETAEEGLEVRLHRVKAAVLMRKDAFGDGPKAAENAALQTLREMRMQETWFSSR